MKTLDRYIIGKILTTFLFVVLILMTIITIIDIAENLDDYAKHQLPTWTIVKRYMAFIPWMAGLIIPLTSFIAIVFVTSRLASHTEIIAMLSGGMSFPRFLFPYFIASSAIAIAAFALNGWVIPHSNEELLDFKMQYLEKRQTYIHRNIHMQVAPNVYMYLQNYNNGSNTGYQFTLERFEGERLIEKLKANNIMWDSTRQVWKLKNWKYRRVDTLFYNPDLRSNKTFISSGSERDTVLSITPEDFVIKDRDFDGMTLTELHKHIEKLRFRGSGEVPAYEVQLHIRYATPFTIYILAFMGAVLSSRKSRGGIGFQIALGFFLSFVFLIFFMMSSTMASNGSIPPAMAAWLPNVTFALISLLLYKFVPR